MNDPEEKARVEFAQAMRALSENWVQRVEFIKLQAKVAKVRYDALRQAGFDVGQALTLCTKQVEL